MLGAARQRIDAERAGEAEGVQHPPAARLRADDPPVLPLIHVEAGLLPAEQIDLEPQTVLPDFEIGRRRLAPGQPAAQRQTLLPPHACVRALDDPTRGEQLDEQAQEQLAPRLDAERQELDDQPIGVAIHDKARHAVALSVDQSIGGGLRLKLQLAARRGGRGQPAAPECGFDWAGSTHPAAR